MNNDQHYSSQELKPEDENVVSVWHGSGNDKFFRRRYFDGFTQYETLDSNGKRELHNVYTGVWYIQQLSKEQRNRRRLLYVALWLVAMAGLAFGATRSVMANIRWYGGLAAFAGLYGLGWIAVGIFNEFIVPQRRTIGDYRASSLGMKRGGLLAIIGCGGVAVISLVYVFMGVQVGAHLLAGAAELVAAALAAGIRFLESKVVYEQKISEYAGKYTM